MLELRRLNHRIRGCEQDSRPGLRLRQAEPELLDDPALAYPAGTDDQGDLAVRLMNERRQRFEFLGTANEGKYSQVP
jgi:hypothetical protein